MNRRVAFLLCFVAALALAFNASCTKKAPGVKPTGTGADPKAKEQETPEWQINHVIMLIGKGEEGDPVKRKGACKRAANLASDPTLTVALRTKLIEALKAALETEKDPGCKEAEAAALTALQAPPK